MSSSISDAISGNNVALSSVAQNYLPEPSSGGMGVFRDILGIVNSVGNSILGAATGGLFSSVGSASAVVSDSNNELILAQIEMQREMQVTSMISNIEKSKHEARMTPVRNIRVS